MTSLCLNVLLSSWNSTCLAISGSLSLKQSSKWHSYNNHDLCCCIIRSTDRCELVVENFSHLFFVVTAFIIFHISKGLWSYHILQRRASLLVALQVGQEKELFFILLKVENKYLFSSLEKKKSYQDCLVQICLSGTTLYVMISADTPHSGRCTCLAPSYSREKRFQNSSVNRCCKLRLRPQQQQQQ